MNKTLAIVLIIAVLIAGLFILTGCGNKTDDNEVADNNAQSVEKNDDTTSNTNLASSSANVEYNYKDGVLTQVVDEDGNPKQNKFIIDGIILIGNRRYYTDDDESKSVLERFVEQGYKKEGINSSFYLNEYINFYIDTKYNGPDSDVKILVTPHKTIEEYEKMTFDQLTTLAEEKGFVMDYQKPDEENYKFVGENFVSMDYPEGKYDILFTYKGEIAYFINITETNEPTE